MNGTGAQAPEARGRCDFCTFGLVVTGEGEEEFLPAFFRSLSARAGCSFRVLRRIGQRKPITSEARKIRMVGSGQVIPTEDEREIGLPARRFLRGQPCHFLILIDDVEDERRPFLAQVFARYRKALDTLLRSDEQRRAAVHFFANMLEAYYYAHSAAVNEALGRVLLDADHAGDVETIRHPKNDLKGRFPGFDERTHGALIVPRLDLDHVLCNPQTCAFLRSMFGWCVRQLIEHCPVHDPDLSNRYQLQSGVHESLTARQ